MTTDPVLAGLADELQEAKTLIALIGMGDSTAAADLLQQCERIIKAIAALSPVPDADRECPVCETPLKFCTCPDKPSAALRDLDTAIWNRLGDLIEASPQDGINAEGGISERVKDCQDSYVKGMRMARLAAIKVVRALLASAPPVPAEGWRTMEALKAVKASGENSARTREDQRFGDVVIAASAWDAVCAAIPAPPQPAKGEGE